MSLFKSSTLASPQLRKRKRRAFEIKIAIAIVIFCSVVLGLSALSNLDALTIHTISAKSNSLVTTGDIAEIANRDMEGNILYLFSKRNFLLYPKTKIRDDIAAAYPILSRVELDLKGFTTLEVSVSERTPKALWCKYVETSDNPFTDDCFLMDASGFVYLKAPEFKGSPYVKYYGRLGDDPLGKSFEAGKLSKLMEFVEGVRAFDVTPLFLYAADNGDYELHLRYGGRVFFNDDSNLPTTLLNLGTILEDNISIPSRREASIDYIDLRYGNRVFFKLNGGTNVQAATTTQSR